MLLFLVNWGYPIVWRYNSKENKSRNPFPSVVQLLTSPDCLVIDLDSTTNDYNLFRPNGKGSPRQRHFKAIFRRVLRGGVAKNGQASGQTSAYLEVIAQALYMEMKEEDQKDIIEAQLKEAFTDGAFTAYRKLTMLRWAGERVDVYANKIRQLAGLAGFEGAGLEWFTKLAFVTGFPNAISIELQQAPNIETLAMGELLARARLLTTGKQSQDVAVAVSSLRGGIAPASKSGSIFNVICNRCKSKGHLAKDCRKRGIRCFMCGEIGHWARDCSVNETRDKVSAPAFSPMKM